MGYLENELEDIARLSKQIDAGTVKPEVVMMKVALLSQSEKRMNLLLKAMAQGAKYGKKQMEQIVSKKIMGDEKAIESAENNDMESITCEKTQTTITRQECLDNSGEQKKECKGCETGVITKRILCGT